jgi:hypothetical protein
MKRKRGRPPTPISEDNKSMALLVLALREFTKVPLKVDGACLKNRKGCIYDAVCEAKKEDGKPYYSRSPSALESLMDKKYPWMLMRCGIQRPSSKEFFHSCGTKRPQRVHPSINFCPGCRECNEQCAPTDPYLKRVMPEKTVSAARAAYNELRGHQSGEYQPDPKLLNFLGWTEVDYKKYIKALRKTDVICLYYGRP